MANYCLICGNELILEDNQMLSDVECWNNDDENADAMITYAHCPHCNCDYEMQDATVNEKDVNENYVGSCKIYFSEEIYGTKD